MAGLSDFITGLGSGYKQAGGVTPGNVFSGPEQGVPDAPQGFAGGAGDFLGSLFGHATDMTIRQLPDFVKDPESFFNNKGELSMTRVLSPDFRRDAVKERKQAEETRKAALIAQGFNQANKFFENTMAAPTAGAAQEYGHMLPAGSLTPEQMNAAMRARTDADAAIQRAAASVGYNPDTLAIMDQKTALSGAERQLGSRYTQEDQTHGGVVTRQNQASQYGYTIGAQNNANKNSEGQITLRDKLARERIKQKGDSIPGAVNTAALAGNTYGRKLLTDFANRSKTIADLENMDEYRRMPHLFAAGSEAQRVVESGLESLTGRQPSKFTRDRTALEQATGLFVANYMQSISGATIPDAEVQRLVKNVPNLATDSYSTYYTKLDAMREAALRDQQLLQAQMDALSKGDDVAAAGIGEMRGKEASALADALEAGGGKIPESDLQYLTPEERAELETTVGARQ